MGEELWGYVILGTVTLHLLSPSWGNCSRAEERKFCGVSSLMGMGAGAAAQPCCTTAKQCRRAAQTRPCCVPWWEQFELGGETEKGGAFKKM